MKIAGVREFKAKLSELLRDIQRGETILITDRGRVVAEVRPPGSALGSLEPEDLRMRQAVDSGFIRPSSLQHEERRKRLGRLLKQIPGVAAPKGTAQQVLDESRQDGQ
jgi:antitoxin (DNA-binding transcriptional repressor) of toxin-antitoxin stability system